MTEAWSQWEGHVVNGEFQLQKYLGGSNQSGVFLTECRGRQPQEAAIKLIAADSATAELQLSRWRLAEKLSHPHLIPLWHMGRCRLGASELSFVVMEYAQENLADVIPGRPLTATEARGLLNPTLEALAYLHGQGIVHGGLKPANVFAINDQLKLGSDGLCAAGESSAGSGKVSVYDSPEKLKGANTPASDVWSLGMTLAQGLTQRLPSWKETEQTDPVLPERLPAPFADIVRGCLRRDPQRRWTVAKIAAQLQPAATAPHERTRVSLPARSAERRFARPAIVTVLAVAAIVAGLGLLRRQQPPGQNISGVKPGPEGVGRSSQKTSNQELDSRVSHPTAASRNKPSPAPPHSAARFTTTNLISDNSAVLHQVLPDVPATARETIQGTVRVGVRVHVDRLGNVVSADLDSPGPSKYFAQLATQAAERWKFTPYDQDVLREFSLRFEFRNTGTNAVATRAAL